MGFEGANVLFDTWVHPLMMGLEEHLIGMFREDFEFHAEAAPSHLGHAAAPRAAEPVDPTPEAAVIEAPGAVSWTPDGEKELKKIPFFVRGKARRNTERFAEMNGIRTITVETLYDAKAYFSR
jgi:light-independent protochlorophyllide reductase subunit B